MGLKCSVLGHKYGDATVERDREEQGSEVVITIREIETCRRCGEERTVSENKEVTTLATPDEPADAESTDDVDEEPSIDAAGDDVGSDEDNDAALEEDGVEAPAIDDVTPSDGTEGAEILEAESDPDEPAADDELADPSIEGPPLGGDPVDEEPAEEDAVIIDEDEDEPDDVEGRQPGEWPEEPDDGEGEDDWTPSDALDEEKPITAPDAGTENNSAVTIPDGQFRCPECGYTTLVEDSSLRAGDFCPECRKGSLVHEPRDETRKE
jgi:hypothetical protein